MQYEFKTISNIESSVKILSEVILDNMDDIERFKNDSSYVEEYGENVEKIVKKFGDNTEGAISLYVMFNPELINSTSGIIYSKFNSEDELKKITPIDFIQYSSDDIENIEWYYLPIKNKQAMWIDPYFDDDKDLYVISYVIPLFKDGETIGIVGMDIDFGKIRDSVNEVKIFDSGYAFLVDEDSMIIGHPNLELNTDMRTVQEGVMQPLIDKLEKSDNDVSDYYSYTYSGEEKILGYSKTLNGWTFLLTAPKYEIFNESRKLTYEIILIMIIGSIIVIIASCFVSNLIAKPIKDVTNIIKKAGELDFTYDNRYDSLVKYKDEIGDLSRAYEKMRKEVKNLIEEIQIESSNMKDNSKELNVTVDQLNKKANHIESEINQIGENIQQTSSSSEEINASILQVSESVEILASKAQTGSNKANKTKLRAKAIREEGNENEKKMKEVYIEKEKEQLKVIEEVQIFENIQVMTDTISDIAEQTNLLSLNASIEAAKAGEHGKGFAVVAEEIRELAEQSATAVEKIRKTISEVKDKFDSLCNTGKELLVFMNSNMENQSQIVSEVSNTYYNDSEFVSEMSDEIASMSEQLSATVIEVTKAIEVTNDYAQKSSESAEIIEENINEVTKDIESVTGIAKKQDDISNKLYNMIEKFKL